MATATPNPSNSLDERLFPLIQVLERPVAERLQHDTHTAPGIPEHKKGVVALVTAGVEMDVLGFAYNDFDEQLRLGVVAAHPRGNHFKKNIIDAFYHGMEHRPDSTFGTVNDDVLAYKNPKFERADFCKIILNSTWET